MKNTYSKTNWVNDKTPINATNLGKIESAISDLYTNAIDASDIISGDGIGVTTSGTGKKISVDKTVMRSSNCVGIDWVDSVPDNPVENKLYFVINSDTKQLSKIMLGSITIFSV